MASLDRAPQLTKDQSEDQRFAKLYRCVKPIDSYIYTGDSFSDSEPDYRNSFVNIFNACSYCRKPRRRLQMNYRSWRFRLLVARYATAVLMSMVFLLASGQDVNNHQQQRQQDTLALNESSRLSSLSLTSVPNENHILSDTENATSVPEPVKSQSRRSSKGLETTAGILSVSVAQGGGVSMNRNSLISGDSVLQRQLREKAKQDSLESIKMHILMRLNLKKLPNITKPISVPQNILENFYKNYNTSLLNSNWGHNNKPNTVNTPRTGLYEPDETATETVTKNTQHNNNSERASIENSETEMQGDDPNSFKEFQYIYNIGFDGQHDDDGEYESILSHISSIYIFPEQPHVRHNRKTEVLRFKFDTGYSDISYITLHLYLRGLDWISAHQPKIIEEISDYQNKDIVVALHRAIRRANSTSYTHKAKIFEFRHKIPPGLGQWVNVDLKPLFGAGMGPNRTQEIFIKGVEPWMRPLVVTTDNTSKNPLTVHIEVGSRKKHRRKRSVFMDCTESDHDMRCCRYPLKVNFTSFGWHFVVAPTSFDAYFCSGDCRVGYLEQYPHTHLAALTTSATPCCSPTKMSSLSLLYFDENHNLVLSVIPNMSVEGCSCS